MDGKVPSGSALNPPGPLAQPAPLPYSPGNCVPGADHPFGYPNVMPGPAGCWFGPPVAPPFPPPPCPPAPPYFAPTPVPAMTPFDIPRPPDPALARHSQEFSGTNERKPPLKANRVNGKLARFDNDGTTSYIFPKHNVTLHIFDTNIIHKYAPNTGTGEIRPLGRDANFNTEVVPDFMTFRELIEALECQDRANKHPPWNRCGYPEENIGIQEVLPTGRGTFVMGTRLTLKSHEPERLDQRIGDTWSSAVGAAGGDKPVYIVRLPV